MLTFCSDTWTYADEARGVLSTLDVRPHDRTFYEWLLGWSLHPRWTVLSDTGVGLVNDLRSAYEGQDWSLPAYAEHVRWNWRDGGAGLRVALDSYRERVIVVARKACPAPGCGAPAVAPLGAPGDVRATIVCGAHLKVLQAIVDQGAHVG